MSEILIVDIVHLVTFNWAISRVWAPYDAWRHDKLDFLAGGVGGITWFVIALYSIQGGGFGGLASATAESPLNITAAFVVMGLAYVVLIAASVKVRIWIAARR